MLQELVELHYCVAGTGRGALFCCWSWLSCIIVLQELVELLARLTVHMDEELRALAFQSLQTLVVDFPEWRHEVIPGE